MDRDPTDRLKVIVHSICGAGLGAGMGVTFWIFILDAASIRTCFYSIGVGALLLGVLAAIYLDDFWEIIKEHGIWPW